MARLVADVPAEVHAQIKAAAAMKGMTLQTAIPKAVVQYLRLAIPDEALTIVKDDLREVAANE